MKEPHIVILFDTGSEGSYLDEKLLPFFIDVQDTGTKFITQSVAATMLKGNGYRFSSLRIGSALIENPLLCSMDMSGVQISTVDGKKIGCVIGMNILSKMPFLFSNSQQKLFFVDPDNLDFLSEYTKVETVNADNDIRLQLNIPKYKKELPFILDAGSPICYLDSGFLKRVVLPNTSLYRYRKNILLLCRYP